MLLKYLYIQSPHCPESREMAWEYFTVFAKAPYRRAIIGMLTSFAGGLYMLRKIMYFVGGSVVGAMAGVAVGLLFTPASGDDIREGARERVQNALAEAQAASAKRREEL